MQPSAIAAALACLALGAVVGHFTRTGAPTSTVRAPLGGAATSAVVPVAPAVRAATVVSASPVPNPTPRSGASGASAAVTAAGVQVQRNLRRAGEFGEEGAFFGQGDPLRVALELDLAAVPAARGKRIIELLSDRSTLTRCVDDHGTDLRGGPGMFGPFEPYTRVSADGLGLAATAPLRDLPHAGATRLSLAGELAVLCASARAVEESAVVAFAPGTVLSIGGLALTLRKVGGDVDGLPNDDPAQCELAFETEADLGGVIAWWVVTEGGEALPLAESVTWQLGTRTQKTLVAPQSLSRGALRVERWTDAAEVRVPFEVEVGLGLP